MLRKPAIVTVIPAIVGQPFVAASTVCTPAPPPNDGGSTPPASVGDTLYYVYVPVNTAAPGAGETRTPMSGHPGGAYVCDVEPQQYFVWVGDVLSPVFERRCYWSYS